MFVLLAAAAAAVAVASPPPPALSQAEHSARGAKCAALADRDPAKAEAEARAWLAANGGMAARQCLGIAQSGLEQWAASATTFEAAAKEAQIAQDPMAVVLWMQAGNAALAGDEASRARGNFDRALALPGLSKEMEGEVHLDRARASVALGDSAAARADLDRATTLVPRDPLGWLLRANLARKSKDLPTAFASIREAAKLSPGDASIAYEAGNIAAASGNMDDARAAWTRAAQAAPDSPAGQAAALALKGGEAPEP
ncbi:tetratricopeptide repeat protein [Sphingomonas sp. Root710]|uniref:tetratricopeptide repeat protein n=1 Tax=Sphingomonas sp. Root710 TaxID=1736594 RepID=UPI000A96A419|nr:tetratricopeptide repeat protein [Sphingomonas sp. Root710]